MHDISMGSFIIGLLLLLVALIFKKTLEVVALKAENHTLLDKISQLEKWNQENLNGCRAANNDIYGKTKKTENEINEGSFRILKFLFDRNSAFYAKDISGRVGIKESIVEGHCSSLLQMKFIEQCNIPVNDETRKYMISDNGKIHIMNHPTTPCNRGAAAPG